MLNDLKNCLRDFQPRTLTDLRFDQSHECFERQSNQQTQILEWLQKFACEQLERRFGKADAEQAAFRILSVGCGSGILDLPLIKTLDDKVGSYDSGGTISYTGIDPNPVACRRFREEFDRLQPAATNLSVVEDTVETHNHDQLIDLTHVVHALYYFAEPAVSLSTLIQQVGPEGQLVIFQAPKGELNQLADCFWQEHHSNTIWFSKELEEHLQQSGISFARSRLDAEVDVTECFDADSTKGSLTLDFIVQSECQSMPQEIRSQVLDYLREISRHAEGKILAPHPVDIFVIHQAGDSQIQSEA